MPIDVIKCSNDVLIDIPDELQQFRVKDELNFINRKDAKELMDECETAGKLFLEKKINWNYRQYLSGTGGTGKSTILFLLVYELANTYKDTWIIFYIPNMHKLIHEESSTVAFTIMDNFYRQNKAYIECSNALRNVYEKCEKDNKYEEHFDEFFSSVKEIRNRNVLYAIDQWNAVINAKESLTDRHVLRQFCHFQHNHVNGPFIVAVSSSFDGIGEGVFLENQAEYCKREIPLFTEEEVNKLFDMWEVRKNPVLMSPELRGDLFKRTRGICRLLEIFYRKKKEFSECTAYDRAFEDACIDYYRTRFESCLRKYGMDGSDDTKKRNFFKVIAQILLNKSIEKACITDKLEATGMFIPIDRNYCGPVCDFVIDAARKYFYPNIGEHLIFFCSNVQTKGYGLELFVFHNLEGSYKAFNTVSLNGRDLGEINLNVDQIKYQKLETPFDGPYTKNTFLVCYPNHPVIDFVYYGESSLYFIQVSTQKYTAHVKKIPELFSSTVYGENVYDYYITRSSNCQIQKLRSRYQLNGKIGKGTAASRYIKYIYITTSTGNCTGRNCGHDVFQIRGDELGKFGNVWHDIKEYFKSE